MKAQGRDSYVVMEATHNGVTIKAVKWYGDSAITLLSTFAAANPTTIAGRWDKKRKQVLYNKSMGGVDLLRLTDCPATYQN